MTEARPYQRLRIITMPADHASLPPPLAGAQPPTSRIYAAALDETMCPACAARAGLEYPTGDPGMPAIPNPACTHPVGCRCQWL